MIVTCPDCETGYRVDAGAFKGGGRSVRCTLCGCEWRQVGPAVENFEKPTRSDRALAPGSAQRHAPRATKSGPCAADEVPMAAGADAQASSSDTVADALGRVRRAARALSHAADPAPASKAPGPLRAAETPRAEHAPEAQEPAQPPEAQERAAIEPAGQEPRSQERVDQERRDQERRDQEPVASERAPRRRAISPAAPEVGVPRRAGRPPAPWREDPADGWSGFPDDRPLRPLRPVGGAARAAARAGAGARRPARAVDRARGRAADRAEAQVVGARRAGIGTLAAAADGATVQATVQPYRQEDLGPRHFPKRAASTSPPTPPRHPLDGPKLRASLFSGQTRRRSAARASWGDRGPGLSARAGFGAVRREIERVSVGARAFVWAGLVVVTALIAYHAGPTLAARSDVATDLVAAYRTHVDDAMSSARLAATRMAQRDGVAFVESKFDIVERPEGRALEVWGKVVNQSDMVALTPGIEIVSRSRNGQPLQRWRAAPERDRLQPGETSRFWARMMHPEGPVHDVDLYIARR